MVYAMLWYVIIWGAQSECRIQDNINYFAGHQEPVLSGEMQTA